jgi:hypothetical protein
MRIITRNGAARAIIAEKKNRVRAQSDGLLHERHGCAILLVFSRVFQCDSADAASVSIAGDV